MMGSTSSAMHSSEWLPSFGCPERCMQICQREDLLMHFQLQSSIDHHVESCLQQPSVLSRCFKLVTEMSDLTLAGYFQSMFTVIMMAFWTVRCQNGVWLLGSVLSLSLSHWFLDQLTRALKFLWYCRHLLQYSTLELSWVNQKFTVTIANCGVFLI